MLTIGVIGQGFVGGAITNAFYLMRDAEVKTYDKYRVDRSTADVATMVKSCEFIFVCVPTPMNDDGSCDTSIMESVIAEIHSHLDSSFSTVAIIKSTIPPGTTDALRAKYVTDKSKFDVIFNPEFLNARSAYEDFIKQDHIVLGGDSDTCARVEDLYHKLFFVLRGDPGICICDAITAETVKYVKNTFFATKVSFANEMYQICQKLGVDYTQMIDIAQNDDRMGWEHWKVPGPTLGEGPWQGKPMLGWAGPCLIKDLNAFMKMANDLGVDPKVMRGAWEKNLEVRPERDWEYIPSAIKNVKKMS